MNKIIAKLALLALVAAFVMPAPSAKAGFTYSRNPVGTEVSGPVALIVTVDSVEELNCNPGQDDFWYVGLYDGINGVEYYPDESQIRPTTDLSDAFAIHAPMGATITEVWTACLTSDENFDSENGGLGLESLGGGVLFTMVE